MKNKFFTFFVAFMASITFANAAIVEGTCGDNLTWLLNSKDSTLTIEGSGNMTYWSESSNVPWYEYRSYIKYVNLPDGLTNISQSAFSGCTDLKTIEIPNTVQSIGESAFCNCAHLSSIGIPNSVSCIENYTFQYCKDLTSIEIPNSVTSIGVLAFGGCISLASIEIPNSVINIGSAAFYDCWKTENQSLD